MAKIKNLQNAKHACFESKDSTSFVTTTHFSAMQGRTQVGAQGDPGLPWIPFFF